jgi:hypothetical protein
LRAAGSSVWASRSVDLGLRWATRSLISHQLSWAAQAAQTGQAQRLGAVQRDVHLHLELVRQRHEEALARRRLLVRIPRGTSCRRCFTSCRHCVFCRIAFACRRRGGGVPVRRHSAGGVSRPTRRCTAWGLSRATRRCCSSWGLSRATRRCCSALGLSWATRGCSALGGSAGPLAAAQPWGLSWATRTQQGSAEPHSLSLGSSERLRGGSPPGARAARLSGKTTRLISAPTRTCTGSCALEESTRVKATKLPVWGDSTPSFWALPQFRALRPKVPKFSPPVAKGAELKGPVCAGTRAGRASTERARDRSVLSTLK